MIFLRKIEPFASRATTRPTAGESTEKDRAADFVTVDLNSLLYKAELDFARLIKNKS